MALHPRRKKPSTLFLLAESLILVLIAEIRLWCSINDKLLVRMQGSFCVGKFCVAELIIIFEISHATQPIAKSHQWDASHQLGNSYIGCGTDSSGSGQGPVSLKTQ
jgi:hypothetical protein